MARCPWFFPTRLVPHRTPRATGGATQAPPKFGRRERPAPLGIRAAFPRLWERWCAAHPTGGWVLHTTPSDVCPGLRQGWSLAGFSSRPPRLILVALIHVPGAVSNAQVPICLLFSDPAQAGATSRSASRRARCFRKTMAIGLSTTETPQGHTAWSARMVEPPELGPIGPNPGFKLCLP